MLNRTVDIQRYWAPVVGKTAEFKQIAVAENPEFNKLAECLRRMLQDAFINDATEYGVSRWEKMLNLAPSAADTLEDRKVRVLTYLSLRLPYTWRVLEQMLSSFVGEGNFTLKYINDFSKLIVRVRANTPTAYDTIQTLLKYVLPQNIVLDLDYM